MHREVWLGGVLWPRSVWLLVLPLAITLPVAAFGFTYFAVDYMVTSLEPDAPASLSFRCALTYGLTLGISTALGVWGCVCWLWVRSRNPAQRG